MIRPTGRTLIPILCFLVSVALAQQPRLHWYKGNTHTHTLDSDGDSTPDDVVKWYRTHGYDFVFITDHEMITDVDPLNALFGGGGQFLVLRAEEVTPNFGDLHVHVNSLQPNNVVKAQRGATPRETLQKDLDAIQAAGGLSHINHPNFFWQLKADDIVAVKGAKLLEIANMHPIVNSFGAGSGMPSAEEIWDGALSLGATIWGVASDDTHELKGGSLIGTAGAGAVPGKGWIVVRAERLTADEIMRAIDKGDFYASTGVRLKDYNVEGQGIMIRIDADDRYQTRYRTQFIGKNGRILQDSTANPAVYSMKGNEGYVRARITDSNGNKAWTQPVFPGPR
jgi:hypothetical protein